MGPAASYQELNERERERLRRLVERLTDEDLERPVNEYWTVAGVLGHIAFWDARALNLSDKLARGAPFTADEDEPEDVDWINDATRPLIHAIQPRRTAELALSLAAETDARVAELAEQIEAFGPGLPFTAFRSDHRAEHLDEIEAALGGA